MALTSDTIGWSCWLASVGDAIDGLRERWRGVVVPAVLRRVRVSAAEKRSTSCSDAKGLPSIAGPDGDNGGSTEYGGGLGWGSESFRFIVARGYDREYDREYDRGFLIGV